MVIAAVPDCFMRTHPVLRSWNLPLFFRPYGLHFFLPVKPA